MRLLSLQLLFLFLCHLPLLVFAADPQKILTADIRHRPPEMIVDGEYQGGL